VAKEIINHSKNKFHQILHQLFFVIDTVEIKFSFVYSPLSIAQYKAKVAFNHLIID